MLQRLRIFIVHRFREPSTRAAIGAGVAIFAPDHSDAAMSVYDWIAQGIGGALIISAALGNDQRASDKNVDELMTQGRK